jgi:hypothetical protein
MKPRLRFLASTWPLLLLAPAVCSGQSQFINDSIDVYHAFPGPNGTTVHGFNDQLRSVDQDGSQVWGRRIVADSGPSIHHGITVLQQRADGVLFKAAIENMPQGVDAVGVVSILTIGPDGDLVAQFGASRNLDLGSSIMIQQGGLVTDDQGGCFAVALRIGPNMNEVIKFQDGVAQWWRSLEFASGDALSQQILPDGIGGCYLFQLTDPFDGDVRITHFSGEGSVLSCRKYVVAGNENGSHFFDADLLANGNFLFTGIIGSQVLGSRLMHMEVEPSGTLVACHLTGPFPLGDFNTWQTQVLPDGYLLCVNGNGHFAELGPAWNPTGAYLSTFNPPPLFTETIAWSKITAAGTRMAMSGQHVLEDQTWGTQTTRTMVASLADGDLSPLCQLTPYTVNTVDMPLDLFTVTDESTAGILPIAFGPISSTYHLENVPPQVNTPFCGVTGIDADMEPAQDWDILSGPGQIQVKAPGKCRLRVSTLQGGLVGEWQLVTSTLLPTSGGKANGIYLAELFDENNVRMRSRKIVLWDDGMPLR